MGKTATITLGGTDYVVHPFNIGELEQVSDLLSGPPQKIPFAVLRLALRRAEPSVPNPDSIEASPDEIGAAAKALLVLSGLQQPEGAPGEV